MAELNEALISKLIEQVAAAQAAAQDAKQIAQDVSQGIQDVKQSAQDTAQSLQNLKQGIQGSQQDKGTYSENKFEEINSGENLRRGTVNDADAWSFNKKLLIASEQSERTRSLDQDLALKQIDIEAAKLELARKQHDFAHQIKLDNLHARVAEHTEVFKHAINLDYAKFNNAVSEPISPNTEK